MNNVTKDWLYEWLNNYVKTTSKQMTFERYCQTTNVHIIPALGDYALNDLQPIVLQRFISDLLATGNKRTGKGLSSNFVKAVISIIQNSLKTAHISGLLSEYTADRIRRPKIFERQAACFSVAEQKKIEQYVLESKKAKLKGIVLCLYTGLRIGELLALTWDDIDFQKGRTFGRSDCGHRNRHAAACRNRRLCNLLVCSQEKDVCRPRRGFQARRRDVERKVQKEEVMTKAALYVPHFAV